MAGSGGCLRVFNSVSLPGADRDLETAVTQFSSVEFAGRELQKVVFI